MSASDHSHNFKGLRYEPAETVSILERREGTFGNRYWKVMVNGVVYFMSRDKGKAVRIAFKPRGSNRGYHWYASVRDETGKTLWGGRVSKSTGPLAILHEAGLIRWKFEVKDQFGDPRDELTVLL